MKFLFSIDKWIDWLQTIKTTYKQHWKRIHPIPGYWTLRNMFHPRNQIRPIPETRSSLYSWDLIDIDRVAAISGIPGIEWRQNCLEFRPIPEFPTISSDSGIPSNSVRTQFQEFRELVELDQYRVGLLYIMMIDFSELEEPIPVAELVPQCSTLWNRMTSH